MAINFPNSPNPNDTWTSGGKTWVYDGTSWKLKGITAGGIGLTDLSVTKPNPTPQGNGDVTYNNTTGVFTYTPPVVGSTSFIGLSDTPSSLTAGKWLKVNVGGTALEYVDNTFTGLTGTPSTYTADKWLKVNAGGTALEWTDAPSGVASFTGLNDTPNSFTANKWLKVNAGGTALEWTDAISKVGTITVADESADTECYPLFSKDPTGDIEPKTGTNIKFNSASGQLEAGSFKKTGGTSSEFLKADGSVDTSTYLTSHVQSDWNQATITADDYIKNKPNIVSTLNDLTNVDAVTNLSDGKILKYDSSANSGTGGWLVGDDATGSGGSGTSSGPECPVIDTAASSSGWVYTQNNTRCDYAGPVNNHKDIKCVKLDNDKVYEFRIHANASGGHWGWYISDSSSIGTEGVTTLHNGNIHGALTDNHSTDNWIGMGGQSNSIVMLNGFAWTGHSANEKTSGFTWGNEVHVVIDMPQRKVWMKSINAYGDKEAEWWTVSGSQTLGSPVRPDSNPTFFLREDGDMGSLSGDYYFNMSVYVGNQGWVEITPIPRTESVFRPLGGSASSGGETNQNAFSNVAVSGQTTVAADGKTDTLTFKASGGMTITTDASTDEITFSSSDNNTQLSSEQVQDIVGAMFSNNTETNITATYQDSDGTIDLVADNDNTQLSTEQVQDIVGAMVDGGTETRIGVTYDDTTGKLGFVVDDMTGSGNLGDLGDVDTSGAQNLSILRHNGTQWQVSEEIQSDWNESNANLTAYIKNKPNIIDGIVVQDEGTSLSTSATTINFTGSGVTASGTGTTKTINIPGGGGGGISGITIKDESTTLSTDATTLKFAGAGVQATGTGVEKTVTIPGGIQVQNDGTPLTTTCFALNFRGEGVTASRTDATKWIDIPGYDNADVDAHLNKSSASDNEVLSWNGTDYDWVTNSSGATNLGDLNDVDTANAGSGKILTHNGTEWQVSSWTQADWTETNANLGSYIKNKPTNILTSVPTLDAVLGAGNTSTKAATVGNFQCANLTVTGTTTTVNSNTVNIGDSNLTLNSDETGTPSQNGGLTIERGTSSNVELRWNETSDKWQYTNDGSTYSDIGSGDTYSIQALITPGIQLLDNGNAGASNRVFFDGLGAVTVNRKASTTDTIEFSVSTFGGAAAGLVPNGSSAGSDKFLKSDGSWDTVSASTPTLDAVLGVGNTSTKSATVGTFTATGTVTAAFLNVKDPKIVLNSDFVGSSPTEDAFLRVERGNSSDVNIKWNESSNKWQATDDGSSYYDLNQTNTNNYATSLSFNSGNGVLTLNRGGTSNLQALTVSLDGRYLTSSSTVTTATNANNVKIRTDTGNARHNLVFVDSFTDNLNQTLKVDNADWSCCYNPSSNCLSAAALQSYHMRDWSSSSLGSYGQFLMSQASSGWKWSTHIHQESNGEIRISGPAGTSTNLEGGHLQFEDSSGSTSYAIDVYRNSVGADKVLRFIDQSTGTERFSVGPEGQWGIGHVGGRSFGQLGQVMISRGPSLSPQWGNASGIAASAVGPDIDKIYAQLNAIGNDSSIITVHQIKAALAAITRN